jgi:succinyl-diaminopimelate desuccinylase
MTDTTALLQTIDDMKDEIVGVLQSLVRIPSITGDEAKIGAFVADICRAMGLEVEVLESAPGRPNVVATWDSGLPGPSMLLNDHLDMIPPGPLEYWTHPPFAAEIDDGRVYGRGTIDTKSGVTTLLMAVTAMRRLQIPIRGKITLLFVCDEEVGGAMGIQWFSQTGRLKADLAVVAEPTTMQIERATKGRMNIGITTRGVATHGARPWLGHNAIEDMAKVVLALAELGERIKSKSHPLLGHGSLSTGIIQGGTVPNMVPNKCRIEVDRRLVPGDTQESVLTEFQAVLDRIAAETPGFDASMEQLLWWPGYLVEEEEPIVQIAVTAFEKVMGYRPVITGKDAGTDASWINALAGIPVVMFSPGNGKNAMNADENVVIEDLVNATKVIAQIACDVVGV